MIFFIKTFFVNNAISIYKSIQSNVILSFLTHLALPNWSYQSNISKTKLSYQFYSTYATCSTLYVLSMADKNSANVLK